MARSLLLILLLVVIELSGCSPAPATIANGMNMNKALATLKIKGLKAVQMQYDGPHQAFDLPDGRTVVLHGGGTVTSIEVVANADLPKSQRSSTLVPKISL